MRKDIEALDLTTCIVTADTLNSIIDPGKVME
jgi:hypothetical protein